MGNTEASEIAVIVEDALTGRRYEQIVPRAVVAEWVDGCRLCGWRIVSARRVA